MYNKYIVSYYTPASVALNYRILNRFTSFAAHAKKCLVYACPGRLADMEKINTFEPTWKLVVLRQPCPKLFPWDGLSGQEGTFDRIRQMILKYMPDCSHSTFG